MNAALTVTDPLAEREVSIVITLAAGKQPRGQRPTLVSVGLAGQAPVSRSGVFGAAMDLIEEAWTAFGVQAQLAEQMAAAHATDVADTAIGTTVVETTVAEMPVPGGSTSLGEAETTPAGADVADSPAQPSTTRPATPKPIASNLSLF